MEFSRGQFREVIFYVYFKIKCVTASNCTFLFIDDNWNLENDLRFRHQIQISSKV